MNEVTIRLQGGLGNYMFQIACAYVYGLKYDKKPVFSTDDSMIAHKHITSYKENVLNNVELVPNWNHAGFKPHSESGFNYSEIPNIDGDVFLHGYFQSEKYFMEYEEEIKKLFTLPSHIFDDVVEKAMDSYKIDLSQDNTCSIHVRRGDYLKLPDHHPTQNMNYYMKAIKKMPKDSKFLIFSDDIQWCKENFPDIPEKFSFIEGGQDFEDLLMMSLCKNNITCNSTFSWWAAWLNKNKEKQVTIPSKWFGSAYAGHNTDDLYCDGWIKI